MLRRDGTLLCFTVITLFYAVNVYTKAIDIFDVNSMEPIEPNYCNNSELLEQAGLLRSTLGQFLGFDCSQEFYHCRWQSDGFRTYRKACRTGLVYDTVGTQNCNYDYNVKGCSVGKGDSHCNTTTSFYCPLSETCVPMHKRCDGVYDCALEEDEQNCPLCVAGEFACTVSEECIPIDRRCNGIAECLDGTDERNCDVCGHGLFHCGKSDECVPIDHRCDGHRDCPNGEDEMLCRTKPLDKSFTCESRTESVPMRQVCDGLPDCRDGSDEKYCEQPGMPQPPQQPMMSLSSNPRPPPEYVPEAREQFPQLSSNPYPPPPMPPAQPEQPEYEEEGVAEDEAEEYDSEKNLPAAFPMISIPTVHVPPPPPPPPPTTKTQRTTRRTTTTPPPTTTRRLTPASFNKPRPKTRTRAPPPQTPEPLPPRAIFVHPTFIEVTAPPTEPEQDINYSEEMIETTTVLRKIPRTRKPSTMRVPISVLKTRKLKVKGMRTTTMATVGDVAPRNQDVDQIRVVPPQARNPAIGRTYSVSAPSNIRVTAPPDYQDQQHQTKNSLTTVLSQSNLLRQISSHLTKRGHDEQFSSQLLNQLEQLLVETEATPPPPTTPKKKLSRTPKWKPQLSSRDVRSFVSRVTKPYSEYRTSSFFA